MKNAVLGIGLVAGIIALASCTGNSNHAEDKAQSDSIKAADSIASLPLLENLLNIHDEEALKIQFGYENVTLDTIWGAEGYFSIGTILKTEPSSHIEITWLNSGLKIGILSVTQVSDSDWYADSLATSAWKSTTGVSLGMSIEELQKINGRPFTFAGFGWDFAGGVRDWQKGDLEGRGIAVQLSEGPAAVTLTPEESAQILGDVDVQSDNPLLKPFKPRVWSISVARVQ